MAIVIRYFSTTAAGNGDGTTWADRAALLDTGAWSTVITGFNFGGSDAMECRIGPGSYTATQTLDAAKFTVAAPTTANYLMLHGTDSFGLRLEPPDPGWVSAKGEWSTTGLPVITGPSNASVISGINVRLRLLKLLSDPNSAAVLSGGLLVDWCHVQNTAWTPNSGSVISGSNTVSNTVVKCLGRAISSFLSAGATTRAVNCRIVGQNYADSYGNANGLYKVQNLDATMCTVINCGNGTANNVLSITRCTIVGMRGTAISGGSVVNGCYISNCATGVDGTSHVLNSRVRNITGNAFQNGAVQGGGTDTSSGTDADEFVNAAAGDYRIKFGSTFWGKGIGAGDQEPQVQVNEPQVGLTSII